MVALAETWKTRANVGERTRAWCSESRRGCRCAVGTRVALGTATCELTNERECSVAACRRESLTGRCAEGRTAASSFARTTGPDLGQREAIQSVGAALSIELTQSRESRGHSTRAGEEPGKNAEQRTGEPREPCEAG